MSCIPKLPFDIFYAIIEQLFDHETLSACSLASSRLRSSAQERIFHKITITVGNITPHSKRAHDILELTGFLTSNSHIARSIHSLTVRILEDFNGASSISRWPSSSTLLRAFPNVQNLYIVDVSRSRYRGWWNMDGEFPDALRSLVQQRSVAILQLGAPGMEREFEWPSMRKGSHLSTDEPCLKHLSSFSVNETGRGPCVLRAASFRDRPDNINTIQNLFVRSAATLTHVWLAFPTHSLPCNLNPALFLHDLVNLKRLILSFNAETLIPPVLRILDTISTEVHGVLNLTIHMRRSSSSTLFSFMAREWWIELDCKLVDMLDRQVLSTVGLEITVFEMGNTFESVVNVLKEVLQALYRRKCIVFKRK